MQKSCLRVDEEYSILPHPGLNALIKGGSKKIWFRDINCAYFHQDRMAKRSRLRIKLMDGSAIALRQGDLGIKPGIFDELARQIDMIHKLDRTNFRT
jgi:hypothetical protein